MYFMYRHVDGWSEINWIELGSFNLKEITGHGEMENMILMMYYSNYYKLFLFIIILIIISLFIGNCTWLLMNIFI